MKPEQRDLAARIGYRIMQAEGEGEVVVEEGVIEGSNTKPN